MDDLDGPQNDDWQARPNDGGPAGAGAPPWPPPPPPPSETPPGGAWGPAWPPPPQEGAGWGEQRGGPGAGTGWADPRGGSWGEGAWSSGGGTGWGTAGWGDNGPWTPNWQDTGPPRPRRTLPTPITALLVVVAVLVGLAIGHGVWRSDNLSPAASGTTPTTTPTGGNSGASGGTSGPNDVNAIAAKADPALVDINTQLSYEDGEAAGTGIVLTSDGLVLTNNHVINGETQINVRDIGNNQTYPAVVLGYDHVHDIALVQMRGAHNLAAAAIGDSSKVSVGQPIVGIGNAGGQGGIPSTAPGTVTALDQSITASDESNGTSEQLTGLIQVDANIQEGDSGGALVNANAQVIGIDTAASQSFSFQATGGQGFAIPIDQALSIAREIQAGATSSTVHVGATAFLGVFINPSQSGSSGAQLRQAIPGGPAAQAGLTGGDVITSINGKSVASSSDLTDKLLEYHPGDKIQVGWVDSNGQSHVTTVQLSSGPPQ